MKIDKGGVSAWPGFRTVGKRMMKCGSRLAGGLYSPGWIQVLLL